MTKTFFTADQHFFHSGIMKYCRRFDFMSPQEIEATKACQAEQLLAEDPEPSRERLRRIIVSTESVEKMNRCLIERWNERVGKKDDCYVLGDIVVGRHIDNLTARTLIKSLNGRIHLILGNHDQWAEKNQDLFSSVQQVKELKINGTRIWLSHYSHRVWPGSSRGALHLYGHSHGGLPEEGLSCDVGVDCHEYYPVPFEQISEVLAARQHNERATEEF